MAPQEGRSQEVCIWSVHCVDDSGNGDIFPDACGGPRSGYHKRMSNYVDHKKYQGLKIEGLNKLAAGPILTDDGVTMIGSQFILQATREVVDQFVENDPFFKTNVWKQVTIARYFPVAGIQQYSH
jgi:uncharacterized protein YciI